MDIVSASILGLMTLLLSTILYLSQYKFNYWKKRKIPYVKPMPLLGNYAGYITLRKYMGKLVQKLCLQFPDAPYIGAYYGTEPTLIVKDPEIIKLVMTKDFYYFYGREITKYCHKEVTTQNTFFNGGDNWKVVRQNMTPLFSSAKMKNMFYLIEKCTYKFEFLLDECVSESNVIEVRTLCARYTMTSIGSCVFGVDTRTMEEPVVQNPFTDIGGAINNNTIPHGIRTVMRSVWPGIFYGMGCKVFPETIDNFFNELLKDVFNSRGNKPSSRHDFVDLVLSLKENKYLTGDSLLNLKDGGERKVQVEVSDDLLAAQCVTMFAGGFETSATTLSFTLFELAKTQEAQKKAQAEVDGFLAKHNNKVTYDCVTELPYLDACLDETLRLYPVLGVLTREVTDNYTFPTGLKVDKGVRIHIPVYHLHMNPDYFPEPEEFKPERFLPENKKDVKPYTYLPFGEGPRACIGKRFGKMQSLAGLIVLLKKYTVSLAEDMPRKMEFNPISVLTQPLKGIHLKFQPRDGWEQRKFAA